jgi:hypothetical protein
MRLRVFVVVLLVAIAAGFLVINPDIASESRDVNLPGATISAPVVTILIVAAVFALLLTLGLGVVADLAHRRVRRHLAARLAQREHELALVKSAAYDRVGGLIEGLHRELSAWLETEGRRRHDELTSRIVGLERTIKLHLGSDHDRSAAPPAPEARRNAA